QASHHHDVVEARGITERFLRLDLNPAAGRNWLHVGGDDLPSAVDRTTAITLIGGKTQHIDKICKGAEGKSPAQNKAHVETWQTFCLACLVGMNRKRCFHSRRLICTAQMSQTFFASAYAASILQKKLQKRRHQGRRQGN